MFLHKIIDTHNKLILGELVVKTLPLAWSLQVRRCSRNDKIVRELSPYMLSELSDQHFSHQKVNV